MIPTLILFAKFLLALAVLVVAGLTLAGVLIILGFRPGRR